MMTESTNKTISRSTTNRSKVTGNTVIRKKASRNNNIGRKGVRNIKKNANKQKHQQYSSDQQISNAWDEIHDEEDGQYDLLKYYIKVWEHNVYWDDIISDRAYYAQSPLSSPIPDPIWDPGDF